jgi:tetratricopeptide (TPR) repeat protein
MKILLFNLGTVDHRILNWGVEGFQSLFEQDIILWGPIPDKKFIYKDKEIPILSFFEQTSIEEVLNKLPKGWYPDIITCDTSVLNYIPDIYFCPVKTVLFTRDSWSDTVFNRGLVELFDFMSSSTIDRELFRNLHVTLLPLSGFAVSVPGPGSPEEYDNRDIDVIAIASYNDSFYHQRYKTFYKLSGLNDSGIKINFFNAIKRSDIYKYYQRSKMVIDWAHTLSNRSFEAALNGCLLFSNEENKVLNDFWKPREEYVPYNEDNLSELITYYVNNPDQAKSIIKNAQQKIQTVPVSWGEMVWDKIKLTHNTDVSTEARIKYNLSTPTSILHYRSATPLIYNYNYNTNYPSNWKELYFERIDKAISTSENLENKISPLIEASRLAFLLKKSELSLKYLSALQAILPDYAWIYYIYGRIYFEQDEIDLALKSLQRAVECALKAPELLMKFVLPVIENGNPCDNRRITSYMWQSVFNHQNEFQVNTLFYLVFELSGFIYQRIEDPPKAITAYIQAIEYVPAPDCIHKLSPLLIQSREFEKLSEITEKGLENSPYDSILIFYRALSLIQLKKRQLAYRVLNEHQKALKSFIGVRKKTRIRHAINIILPFILLSKHASLSFINSIIRSLKNHGAITYLK